MKKETVEAYNDKRILKMAKDERKVTQVVLAEQLGMLQSGLSSLMTRPRMSLGMFTKILDAMEYDVVVIDRKSGESKWKVEVEK